MAIPKEEAETVTKQTRWLTGYPLKGATMCVSMCRTFLQRSIVETSRPLGELETTSVRRGVIQQV